MQIAKRNSESLLRVWSEKKFRPSTIVLYYWLWQEFFSVQTLLILFHQKVNNKPTLITNYSNNNLEPRRSYLANQFSFLIATLCEGSIFHDLCYGKNKLSLFLFQLKKEEFYMPTFQKRKLCSLWHFFYSYFFF